ncbi:MAG: hypothetical protein JWP09_863 [Candidatus Taylorbacteria bacterium]|nr:hypothetical protein [Candidatus Taylorbacteria bacterium]
MNQIDNINQNLKLHSRVFTMFVRTQDVNFWILFAFIPTFIGARLLVYHFPNLFLLVRGVHVHHLTYGIFLLAIAGILAINFTMQRHKVVAALIYGIGLALSFDEFGMWLHLQDNYWIRQSYDAIIMISAILFGLVYLPSIVKSIAGLYKHILEKK